MVRNPRVSGRRSVDMSVDEHQDYEIPDHDDCDPVACDQDLGDADILRVQFWTNADDFIVDFAIVQLTRGSSGWCEVARIDCYHSSIHRHQYVRGSDNDVYKNDPRREICQLSAGDHELVHEKYGEALEMMENEWEDNLRRWQRG